MPAIVLGLVLGIAANANATAAFESFAEILTPVGMLWTNFLRLIAIPLVVCLVIPAIANMKTGAQVGRMGAVSLATFACLLVAGAALAVAATIPITRSFPPTLGDAEWATPGDAVALADAEQRGTLQNWLTDLIPSNAFSAAASGDLLPLLVVVLLFAIALRGVSEESRGLIVHFFVAVGEVLMRMVEWAIIVMPLGVFALAFKFGMDYGLKVAGVAGYFILLMSALCIVYTLFLYPVAVFVGRVRFRDFARAVFPAQAVAATTRSSLASLPTLMADADKTANIHPNTKAFVLPLAASIFKPNRTVTSISKFIFLAVLFGVPLDPAKLVVFSATVMVLSIGTPGIPSGSAMSTLGAYVAAGIPAEGYLFFKGLDAVPDIFKTVANVTGFMSAASVVGRFAPAPLSCERAETVSQARSL